MADEEPKGSPVRRSEPIVMDSSKWGGVDLPDIGDELDELPPEERAEAAKSYRILVLGLVGLLVGAVVLAMAFDVSLRGLGKLLGVPLILLLSYGVIAAFGRGRWYASTTGRASWERVNATDRDSQNGSNNFKRCSGEVL